MGCYAWTNYYVEDQVISAGYTSCFECYGVPVNTSTTDNHLITAQSASQPLWAEEGRWTDKSQTIWPGPVPSAPLARYLNWQLQTRQTELHQPHLFVELETLREHSSRLNQNCKMLISCQLLEVESCFWNSSYSCKVFPSVGNPQLVLELLFRDKF